MFIYLLFNLIFHNIFLTIYNFIIIIIKKIYLLANSGYNLVCKEVLAIDNNNDFSGFS